MQRRQDRFRSRQRSWFLMALLLLALLGVALVNEPERGDSGGRSAGLFKTGLETEAPAPVPGRRSGE